MNPATTLHTWATIFAVVLTATVTASSGTPTGTITFDGNDPRKP